MILKRISGRVATLVLVVALTATGAFAETLMMPGRDARMSVPMVVWGVTTQPNGTQYTVDFGDGNVAGPANVADRSYIAFQHTYANQGVFTVTLTVGTEVATTDVTVFDVDQLPGGTAGDANRSLGINMAIEDGLRNLWVNQWNRAGNFPSGVSTFWNASFPYAGTSLIALAFENHGYGLENDGSAPTGIYEKYIVRRALNYVMSNLSTVTLGVQGGTRNPCVGGVLGVWDGSDCIGLRTPGDPGYSVAVAILPFAASGALDRVNTEVGGVTAGMTFGEVLQRLVNTQAWGQFDGTGIDRGGWVYQLNSGSFDGSTAGWAILGFLDAAAAGAIVPDWVATEFKFGFDNALNNDGSFDYRGNGNPASNSNVGPAKVGIGLQGLFFTGELSGSRVDAVVNNIASWWPGASPFGIGGNPWGQHNNHGGAYPMFNMFKGLKLMGIQTLPTVSRPAGPGSQPAGDWHADYQDWFVANQTSPNTVNGGSWGPAMSFSCCYNSNETETAIAELILSPVALVLPDEQKFSTVGLSPATDDGPAGGDHTVTAKAESTGGTPVAGATVVFEVIDGPNAGLTGTDTTDSNGEATFTYTDGAATGGQDTIQAFIGNLESNAVVMNWIPPNSPPVADLQAPLQVELGELIGLDGSLSTDPDLPDDTLTYIFGGAEGTIVVDTEDEAMATVDSLTLSGVGFYTFDILVTDSFGETSTADVTVEVIDTTAPTVSAESVVVEQATADGTSVPVESFNIVAEDLADDDLDISIEGELETYPLGVTSLTIVATDDSGNSAEVEITVTVEDTTAPDLTVPADVLVELATEAGNIVELIASATDICDADVDIVSDAPAIFPLGTTVVTFTATDDSGNQTTDTMTVTVEDTTAPDITSTIPSACQLWPPNHQMVGVGQITASDIGGVTLDITAVSNEPVNDAGDGNTEPDIVIGDDGTVEFRAERAGTLNSRTYTVTATATDPSGNETVEIFSCVVPHDQGNGNGGNGGGGNGNGKK